MLGSHSIGALVADSGSSRVGSAGGLGQAGVPGLPGLLPADAPGAQRGLPGGAYPGAVHAPPRVTPPHSHAAAGRGRGAPAHVDAGPLLGDHPHPGSGPRWATCGGGGGGPCPPGGGIPDSVWSRRAGGRPPDGVRNGAGPGLPSPRRPLCRGSPGAAGAYPQEASASPQGYPGATCVAGPPRCGTSPPPEGAHTAVASGTQGLDPESRTHLPGRSRHRGPGGQNHPDGDDIP